MQQAKEGHRPVAVRRRYVGQTACRADGESGERILGGSLDTLCRSWQATPVVVIRERRNNLEWQ